MRASTDVRRFCNGFVEEIGKYCTISAGCRLPWAMPWADSPPPSSPIPSARRPHLTLPLLVASAAMAVAPDLDLLVGSHRTYTHSVGAVARRWRHVVAARAGPRHPNAMRAAAMLTAAYASHLVLDWTGKDTSTPPGLTVTVAVLVRRSTCQGGICSVKFRGATGCRRSSSSGTCSALSWELAVLSPLLILAWARWSRRTLKTKNEKRKTNKASPTR